MKKYIRSISSFGTCAVLVFLTAFVISVRLFLYGLDWIGGVSHPVIEVQREFELGEHEVLTTLEVPVIIRNRGNQPLTVDQVQKNCGCLGVFTTDQAGERKELVKLEIQPQESITLFPQLAVVGHPRMPVTRRFTFRTNDPHNQLVDISMRVVPTAHYFAMPLELVLGQVVVGERVEREIQIRAHDRTLPAITRVSSSNERIHARYERIEAISDAKIDADPSPLIGRLHAYFDAPSLPGNIGGAISLFCEGRQDPAVTVPVTGRVERLIELSPHEVMLPRVSQSGPIYTANCLCRAALSKPLRLRIQKSPVDVLIQIKDVPENPSMKQVQIDAARVRDKVPAEGLVLPIALSAVAGDQTITLTLKITVQRP